MVIDDPEAYVFCPIPLIWGGIVPVLQLKLEGIHGMRGWPIPLFGNPTPQLALAKRRRGFG